MSPNELAVVSLQGRHITVRSDHIQPIAIDSGRTSWAFRALRASLTTGWPETRHPQFLAIRFGQGPNDFVVTAIAHAEDPAGGH
jgi:hypothetical protein